MVTLLNTSVLSSSWSYARFSASFVKSIILMIEFRRSALTGLPQFWKVPSCFSRLSFSLFQIRRGFPNALDNCFKASFMLVLCSPTAFFASPLTYFSRVFTSSLVLTWSALIASSKSLTNLNTFSPTLPVNGSG